MKFQGTSDWECQKNKALLQLVHQNEELTRLLKEVSAFDLIISTRGKYILFIESQRMLSFLLDFYTEMSLDK